MGGLGKLLARIWPKIVDFRLKCGFLQLETDSLARCLQFKRTSLLDLLANVENTFLARFLYCQRKFFARFYKGFLD